MKTTKKIFTILTLVFASLAACNTIDQPYYMGYKGDEALKTPERVRLAAVSMYDAMQDVNFLGGRAQIYADVRGIDTNPASYFGGLSLLNGSLMANATIIKEAWASAYRTVGALNGFMDKLNAAKGIVPDDEAAMYINEARFLRGVTYFYILNLWGDQYTKGGTGLGVPWIEKSYDGASALSEQAIVPRSTTTDIYAKIVEDLKAGTNLPATRGDKGASLYFATSNAAWAMLSRVHLFMGNYADVITAAANVKGYELDAEPAKTLFVLAPTSSKEVVFWIAHNETDNPNTNHALGQHYGKGGRADINVSESYLNLFDKTKDTRYTTLIVQSNDGNVNFTNKYPNRVYNWAPVVRYAEVLLNEAEARAKQASDVDATAITLVNRIRTRAGVDEVKAGDFADKAAFVKFILEERRRELAFEGHGSFDLFRNQMGIEAERGSATAAAIPYPDNLFALPIPAADWIRGKGKIVQNPGY